MKNGVYTSLDIGTTSIKVIVSEINNGQLNVIGVGSAESNGLKRGMIVDIDQTVRAIKSAVKQASDKSGIAIEHLVVGVPASNVVIEPCHGVISVKEHSKEISSNDVIQVLEQSIANIIPAERDLLSVMLEEFIVDGFDEINDPRGMVGQRLELYGTAISVPKTILHNIKKCVEQAGFVVQNLILQPQAMAQVALSDDERNFGAVQIDMGGGQTTVSAVHDHQLKYSTVIQEGGEYVSKDISIVLNTSQRNAENLKREVGFIGQTSDNTVHVDVVGKNDPELVEESYIGEIIEARLVQIFEKAKAELDKISALDLPGGVIISGGAASTPGIKQLAKDIFGVRTTVYIPDYMGIRSAQYTVAVGLTRYEASLTDVQRVVDVALLKKMGVYVPTPSQVAQPKLSTQTAKSPEQSTSTQQVESFNREEGTLGDKVKNLFSSFFE